MKAHVLASLILASLAAGCVPEFTQPLPFKADRSVDHRLLGHWTAKEDNGDENHALFFRRGDGWYDIVFITGANASAHSNGLDCTIYEGYSAMVGTNWFLSFRARPQDLQNLVKKPDRNNFMLAEYSVTDKAFVLHLFSEDKVRAMIRDGKLKGTAETTSDLVLVTEGSQGIENALSTNNPSAFWDEDRGLNLQRSP